jgi:hypothetical protein
VAPELIDNMEDGNQNILINDGRTGAWYTANGKGGSADPLPASTIKMPLLDDTTGSPGSKHGFHFKGDGGTEWGAMAAFDFLVASTPKLPYDAGTFKGITFWVKGSAAVSIQVRVPLKDTTADANGACMATTNGCENHFAAQLDITTSWQHVSYAWADFQQDPAWGYHTTFKPAQLVSVQFVVPIDVSGADFWIDDIAFIP